MNYLEKNFISTFVAEIATLNGTEFENVSAYVLSLILRKDVEQKGHNLYDKPVGYSGDILSSNYEVVGQCGTSPKYFKDLSKPIDDIKAAINNHSKAKTVYLFANQRAPGGKLTDIYTEAKKLKKKVVIYDAEKMAKLTLKNIDVIEKAERILSYLPNTYEYYKILPQASLIPSFKSKYFERPEEKEILLKIRKMNVLQIHGVSGIGKTQTTISIVNQVKKHFETIIWIEGETLIKSNFNLSSVHASKFNSNINLSYFIERHKTLLVVDNLNDNVQTFIEAYNKINTNKSSLIITSYQRDISEDYSYNLTYLDNKISKQILKTCNVVPQDKEISAILKFTNGFPLILTLLISLVENDGFTWNDIISELNILKDITDDKNQKISDRIIGNFRTTLDKEFSWIAALNSRKISRHFLNSVIGKIGINKLEKRSLITIRDINSFDMHQIVLDSIKDNSELIKYKLVHENKLKEYLEKNNEIKSIQYFVFLINHKRYLLEIYNELAINSDLKKILLYSFIQSGEYSINYEWFISELSKFNLDPSSNYQDLLLYIERAEIELYKLNKSQDRTAFNIECNTTIKYLESIMNATSKVEHLKVLYHHIGKFYIKIQDSKKALELFSKVLFYEENADYCQLQVARIYINEKQFDKVEEAVDKVLGRNIDIEKQSLAILLSFYELISNNKLESLRYKYIIKKQDFFMKVLIQSLDSKFEHPYRVLETLSGYLAYSAKDMFKEICEILPFPADIETNKTLKMSYAGIQLAYFKLLKFSNTTDTAKLNEVYEICKNYYGSVVLSNDFERKKLLDLYIQYDKLDEADELIENFSGKENAFYFQNKCKIYRKKGLLVESLEYIDKALKFKSKIQDFYTAALLNDKAETLYALKNKECLTNLEEAITLQTNQETINNWVGKLNMWSTDILF